MLHNLENNENGDAFCAYSAFGEFGRLDTPMGERWDRGRWASSQKVGKARKALFLLILEIHKQKQQELTLSFVCFMGNEHWNT